MGRYGCIAPRIFVDQVLVSLQCVCVSCSACFQRGFNNMVVHLGGSRLIPQMVNINTACHKDQQQKNTRSRIDLLFVVFCKGPDVEKKKLQFIRFQEFLFLDVGCHVLTFFPFL